MCALSQIRRLYPRLSLSSVPGYMVRLNVWYARQRMLFDKNSFECLNQVYQSRLGSLNTIKWKLCINPHSNSNRNLLSTNQTQHLT